MKKVSVIVPVYNAEKYLDECLTSLVNQTLDDIEIICVNDGSTDNSLDILKKYEKKYRAIKVYDQEDLGQANACNRGLDLATGEYVCQVDSDDFVEEDYLENCYNLAKANKSDVVRCGFYSYAKDLFKKEVTVTDEIDGKTYNPSKLATDQMVIVFGRPSAVWAGIYKRKFLLKNNIRYREGVNFEDTSLEFKIRASATNYTFTSKCYYYHRVDNPDSGSATINDTTAIFKQYEEIKDWCMKNNPDLWDFQKAYMYYNFQWAYNRLTTETERKKFREIERKWYLENLANAQYFNSLEDYFSCYAIMNGDL